MIDKTSSSYRFYMAAVVGILLVGMALALIPVAEIKLI